MPHWTGGGNQWQEPKAAKEIETQLLRREENEWDRGAREKVLSVWANAYCSLFYLK